MRSSTPTTGEEWRQEFLDFAKSRNITKSYKPVLLQAMLKLVNRDGEVKMDDLVREFRAFYIERQKDGLPVEFNVPLLSNPQSTSNMEIKQLI